MIDTLDDALLRLKGELLAPDWQLNDRRAVGLLRALAVVEGYTRLRRAVLMVCAMARAAVDYLRPRGSAAPPAVLDFLKQALAHLVVMLEEDELDSAREEEIMDRLYGRFMQLKAWLAANPGNKRSGAGR
jgi:hypothetical protein